MTRKDLQELSRIRLREAKALARLGMNDGAYYLAGYCVECALKSCIAKLTQRHEFPNRERTQRSYVHKFGELLKAAGLEQAHQKEAQRDQAFLRHWNVVQLWSPDRRYLVTDAATTRELIEAVSDRNHGVLRWIKLHW
jgi:HEPN domain-containing protein